MSDEAIKEHRVKLEHASRGDILNEYFNRMRALKDLDREEEAQPHANALNAICAELRDRALEKNDVDHLRDVHTLVAELNGELMSVGGRIRMRLEKSGLHLPDGSKR